MEAPLHRIGPGQHARWAYQVLGSDGPIPNPRRIRYLAAPPAGAPVGSAIGPTGPAPLAAAASYMQAAALGISLATLGVSVATLAETRRQTQMLRKIQAGLEDVHATVHQTVEITKDLRLDIGEGTLRQDLRYAIERSASEDGVDLEMLAELVGKAVAKFDRKLEETTPGLAPGLLLSSEVQDLLHTCLNLLWSARETMLLDSRRDLRVTNMGVDRYSATSIAELIADRSAVLDVIAKGAQSTGECIRKHLADSFKFYGSSGWYRDEAIKRVTKDIGSPIATLPFGHEAQALLAKIPPASIAGMKKSASPQRVASGYRRYLTWWFAGSDAGLLWLLRTEIAVRNDPSYWSGISSPEQSPASSETTTTPAT